MGSMSSSVLFIKLDGESRERESENNWSGLQINETQTKSHVLAGDYVTKHIALKLHF